MEKLILAIVLVLAAAGITALVMSVQQQPIAAAVGIKPPPLR
jgi:hypothetical protein